jgi:hypothetical protein
MKAYKVTYKETLIHTFYVEAENIDDAEDTFNKLIDHGKIDFSDGEIDTTELKIEENE